MVVQLLGYCGQLSEECSAGMHNFTRMLKLANQGKQFFSWYRNDSPSILPGLPTALDRPCTCTSHPPRQTLLHLRV